MSASKAHNLPTELILCIVDIVQSSFDFFTFYQFTKEFVNMQLLNRHWCAALRTHPAYMTTEIGDCFAEEREELSVSERYYILDRNVANFKAGLQKRDRRNKVVQKLIIFLDDELDCGAFRSIFDNHFDVLFINQLEIRCFSDRLEEFEPFPAVLLPDSLKVQKIYVAFGSRMVLDWSIINEYLRCNITNLELFCLPKSRNLRCNLPSHNVFEKLSKLLLMSAGDPDDLEGFLKAHPTIEHLKFSIRRQHFTPKPHKVLKGVENIRSLIVGQCHLDFSKTYLPSLRQLTIDEMWEPLVDWSDMPEALDELRIQYVGMSRTLYGDDRHYKFADYIGEDHLLVNPNQLQKLNTLRVLEITHTKSATLARKFNDGVWDNTMPHLEVLKLEIDGVVKEAVDRFVSKHPRLKSVSYGVEYGFNERRKDRYIKGPVEAYRCK